ncbi:MAG: hypothetical protein WBQ25_15585 [Nitrososphaeraceae archaeon]
MSLRQSSLSTAVYGLSTEGYRIASSIAIKGLKVSLIDESARVAIAIKPDIARNYPNVNSLIDDESLLGLEPIDIAISTASYIFFAPKIRKIGQDVKSDVMSKFRDAIKNLRKGSSFIYALPTGIGGNDENIALMEHLTGMNVGDDINYYYMPICNSNISTPDLLVGSIRSRQDAQMERLLLDSDTNTRLNFVDILSAELAHSMRILEHYTGLASILEICKQVDDVHISNELMSNPLRNVYLDEVANGLYDLRAIAASLGGAGPLMYLVNGTIKGTEAYIKHLIDEVRDVLKKRDLKASRTKVVIKWSLDLNEMRGDKLDLLLSLESKLKDYIGDVELHNGPSLDLYPSDKTIIIITCSKDDYARLEAEGTSNKECIIMKANPVCEIVG